MSVSAPLEMGSAPARGAAGWDFLADTALQRSFLDVQLVGRYSQGLVLRGTSVGAGGREVTLQLLPRERLAGKGVEHKEARKRAGSRIAERSLLRHPLIEEYLGGFVSDFYLVAVFDCATVPVRHRRQLPSLAHVLDHAREGLTEDVARFYFQQLVVAVDYCHKKQVTNMGLQLDHCLLHDEEGSNKLSLPLLKLCDWGFLKSSRSKDALSGEWHTESRGYCAPEVIISSFNKSFCNPYLVDVYACGVILWKLLCGQHSWPGRDPEEEKRLSLQEGSELYEYHLQMQKGGLHLKFTPDNKVSLICKDLLMKILEPDHRCRWNIRKVLEHPWFTSNLNEKSQKLNDKLLKSEPLSPIEARAPAHLKAEALINRAATLGSSDGTWAPDKCTPVVAATILDVSSV